MRLNLKRIRSSRVITYDMEGNFTEGHAIRVRDAHDVAQTTGEDLEKILVGAFGKRNASLPRRLVGPKHDPWVFVEA